MADDGVERSRKQKQSTTDPQRIKDFCCSTAPVDITHRLHCTALGVIRQTAKQQRIPRSSSATAQPMDQMGCPLLFEMF
ncbi:hypothetical protein ACRE_055010 [Hapsidospora chrysogenum ATCC 11550]|uniref:Uncharacterized protein n=1 Tax=Hapsidospora chrysogenum (strain ATCC 11550 / CBS 779.69 / DSM 880 / IAM 14645 / JCM 23072 / IMI 49137) TaxID=857340 RepID=A0A086T303_HAPC1|nr:hypothetical protein ACRE_055010 [Hapsidospora chrysogenum ATCC 11550]